MLTQNERNTLEQEFKKRFPDAAPQIFFSPSRINIIGEHIDYNGGKVLPAAISIGTYGLLFPSDTISLYSLNIDHEREIPMDDLTYNKDNNWRNYVTGMLTFLKKRGYAVGGISGVIYGNIPKASGLSSSASLELLIGYAVSVFYNNGTVPMLDLILAGKDVENIYLGLHSGIMDQFAIGMGRKDHALLIDTATLEFEYVPADFGDYHLTVLNTNKPRSLVDSKYNERCDECARGLKALQSIRPELENLCQVTPEELEAHIDVITDPVVAKRVRHVVEENVRVREVIDTLSRKDFLRVGELLNEGHASLRDLYEVTGPELDAITDAARSHESCIGARMTGAGFGGCAVALIRRGAEEDFARHVKEIYRRETGLDCDILDVEVFSGPMEGKMNEEL